MNIPLHTLLKEASPEDDTLQCYVNTGSATQAKRICQLLRHCLMLNMVSVVNQYAFQKDDYVPGESLIGDGIIPAVREQVIESAESGIQILTAKHKGNSSPLYERRWADITDPDLLFDVVQQVNNTPESDLPNQELSEPRLVLCGHHADTTRLHLTGLIGVTWPDHAIYNSSDIAEFTHDTDGLLLEFNGHTLSGSMDLKDRLIGYSRNSAGSIVSRTDLAHEAIRQMPPALKTEIRRTTGGSLVTPDDLYIVTRFGPDPEYRQHAIPITVMTLPVRDSSDTLMRQHCQWLCHTLTSQGLPCLLYTSPSPRDLSTSRMPSSA